MNAPLSRYLARFSTGPVAGDAVLVAAPAPEPVVTLTVADLDARLDEATRTARDAAEAAQAVALAELESRHAAAAADAVAAARAERTEAEADALRTHIDGAFAALNEQLAEALAKVLRPVVVDAVRVRALEALTTALARLTDDGARAITLRAPADLVGALSARGAPAGIALAAADVDEAVATLDGTRIETRLAAALADIEAA